MKIVIISIALIIIAVVIYAIFAPTTTSTSSGTTTDIHSGALGWLKGILNGLNISLVGK